MTGGEYEAFLATSVAEYAEEKVKAGTWSVEESLGLSHKAFTDLLPQGPATPNHLVSTAFDTETGKPVGLIWIHLRDEAGERRAFVYDIVVAEQMRGRGYGRAVMQAAAIQALDAGAKAIGLHVFGHNNVAIGLYESLGYVTTDMVMSLRLDQ
jgi:ribosomal protein S18 acetylase RimI-like enzyme